MSKPMLRATVFAVLMACAVLVAAAWMPRRYLADEKPKFQLAQMFPERFAGWEVDPSIVPVQPAPDLQKVLDATYDQTLARTYRNARGDRVMLSIAYGRNQNEGMNTHRPEICYPAQGLPISAASVRGDLPFGKIEIPVTRLVATKDARNEPITYWLIVGDRITHFGDGHKLATLRYGLSGRIPDGMLVRISSIDPDSQRAFALQQRFADDMLGAMSATARTTVLGQLASTS
ncbi:MAG: EpsI family protein [Proteobacteria bacterium]|nr:EpsI family protein [Pseudomonadota bacterium]